MKTVGIIGPYTPRGNGNHAVECLENIQQGILLASELVRVGFAPYCPYLDFQYVLTAVRLSEAQLKAVSMEWIRRCDVIIAMDRWRESDGASAELQTAELDGIPIVYSIDELLEWDHQRRGGP